MNDSAPLFGWLGCQQKWKGVKLTLYKEAEEVECLREVRYSKEVECWRGVVEVRYSKLGIRSWVFEGSCVFKGSYRKKEVELGKKSRV